MRKILLILSMFLIYPVCLLQAQDDRISDAFTAYDAGDYENAITLFQSISTERPANAESYYNLATACYMAERYDCAILNYRRALYYQPRDLQIQTGLALARLAVNDRPDVPSSDPLITIGTLTDTLLTRQELAWSGFIIWCIVWFLVLLYRLRPGWRDGLRYLLAGTAMSVTGILVLLGIALAVDRLRPVAVVTADSARVWSGPGEDYLPLYTLENATEIRVQATQANWIQFVTRDGRRGWMTSDRITHILPEQD